MNELKNYFFSNLKVITKYNDSTSLCYFEPENCFYINKDIDKEQKDFYNKLKGLNCPNLAKIKYVFENELTISVIREYVNGKTLNDYLKEKHFLDEKEVKSIALQICCGLKTLHSNGIIHRDITPNNIVISDDGAIKIIDFEISRTFKPNTNSDTVIMGTPGYAAPEQFGFNQSDSRTDIYSLGVLMNFLLTGKMPRDQKANGKMKEIIDKCIEIDAKNRFNSVDEVINALNNKKIEKNNVERIKMPNPFVSIIWFVLSAVTIFTFINWAVQKRTLILLLTIGACIVFYPIPLMLAYDAFSIAEKLPIIKKYSRKSRKIFIVFINSVLICIGICLMGEITLL